jgi:hypothetical protein
MAHNYSVIKLLGKHCASLLALSYKKTPASAKTPTPLQNKLLDALLQDLAATW